ncbi:MAG: type II secretion system F family protein [Bdellovibrionaceae bacterium]|nr:type II secretion system F family protein [Pseudobdellovibrionaceae bacterium]
MFTFDFFILFSGLGLAALSVYLFMTAVFTNNADAEALAWASGNEPVKSKSSLINFSRPLVHNFTLQHAQRINGKKHREKIRRKLMTAGLSQELNEDEFIGLQILWGIMFPIGLFVLNFALQMNLPVYMFPLLALVGWNFPSLYCSTQRGKRYTAVVVDLPFFIDLMALSTEAGLDFMGSLQRIIEKAEDGVLAEEIRIVLKDLKLGSSRREAMTRLAERLDIPEITSFVAVVRDAEETGAPISQVLKDQSIQMRLERFVRAEKAGAKASQAMLIPLMFLILPAVFLMVFAPVVLQFFYGAK